MKNILLITGAAALSALLLTLASPGYDLWPLAYLALAPALLTARKTHRGFLSCWLFGFLFYAVNLRWVIASVSDFGNAPFAVGVLVTALFAAFLGLFWGLFGWLFVRKSSASLLLAGVLVTLEVVKSSAFSGFPMLNLAHTQASFLPAIQIAEITGEYGISLIIAYTNLALVSLISDRNRQPVLVAAILIISSFGYGFSVKDQTYAGNPLKIRVSQPAYSQAEKWVPENKYDIMTLVNGLVRETDPQDHDLLVLPETVYPAFMNDGFAGYHFLDAFSEKVPVIAGGIRYDEKDGKRTYYNSVFMFDSGKVSVYDKLHLVPFGEYFPLKTLFKPIDYYFFKGAEDFSPGKSASVFSGSGFTAAPMICYESMYSGLMRDQVMLGADIITLVTNDSWFGATMGPYQHLAADIIRAVEFRKPVVRAAQSGISACIEPGGGVSASIPTGVRGHIDCELTPRRGLTVFASGGYGWLAVFLIGSWVLNRRKERKGNSY